MLRKFILSICALSLFSLAPSAKAGLVKGEAIRKQDLEQEFAPYKDIKIIESGFHMVKSIRNFSAALESKGRVMLNKEKPEEPDFTWTTEQPNYFRFHSSGSKIESFDSPTATEDRGFVHAEEWNGSIVGPAIAWMAMDFEKILRSFMVFKISPAVYKLIPKGFQESNTDSITISVNAKKLLEHVVLLEKSKDETRLSFSDPHLEMKK